MNFKFRSYYKTCLRKRRKENVIFETCHVKTQIHNNNKIGTRMKIRKMKRIGEGGGMRTLILSKNLFTQINAA